MNHLSLFSGIGGIDLAAQWAGINTVCFCEINPFCQKVLNKHWPDVPIIGDIKDVTKEKVNILTKSSTIDLITGGFPCQPVSKAGLRKGYSDDRWLWPEMLRVIREIKPTWVVGENVDGLINMAIENILLDLESSNYITQTFLIPACAVGATDIRYRVFIVAHSGSIFSSFGLFNRYCNQTKGWGKNSKIGGKDREFIEMASIPNRRILDESWEFSKPKLVRIDDGIPNGLDRIRALGNAVKPQQVYPILKVIYDIEQLDVSKKL
jgi:DNA (cytosine-5)-methyltransferase 1